MAAGFDPGEFAFDVGDVYLEEESQVGKFLRTLNFLQLKSMTHPFHVKKKHRAPQLCHCGHGQDLSLLHLSQDFVRPRQMAIFVVDAGEGMHRPVSEEELEDEDEAEQGITYFEKALSLVEEYMRKS